MEVPEWLKWIGGGLAGIVSLLLGSNLVMKIVDRRHAKADRRELLHESNQTAHIGAQTHAFDQIIERLKTVEGRVDQLQDQLSQEMAKAARLEEQNRTLASELERQRTNNHALRNAIQEKELEVVRMKGEIAQMQEQIIRLTAEIERLSKLEARTHE